MDPYSMTAYLIIMGASTLAVCMLFYVILRKTLDFKKEKALPLVLCVLLLSRSSQLSAQSFLFYFPVRLCHKAGHQELESAVVRSWDTKSVRTAASINAASCLITDCLLVFSVCFVK